MRALAALFVALVAGCAVTPAVRDTQPIKQDLTQYGAIYASIEGESGPRSKSEFPVVAKSLLEQFVQNLNLQGRKVLVGPAPKGEKALHVRLLVTEFNYVEGGRRMVIGVLAGTASLEVAMTLDDAATGARVGQVVAGSDSNPAHGIFGADTAGQVEAIAKQLASRFIK